MYNEKMEELISAALADGVLTEKEKQILFKKAQSMGIDLDEFEMVLDARLVQLEKENAAKSAPKSNKLGDVRKCPQCGAVIGTFQMVCPECGFEFTNVGPNAYVAEFARKLSELPNTLDYTQQRKGSGIFTNYMESVMKLSDIDGSEELKRKEHIISSAEARFIRNYPLPMTKEDCIEMLNYILPKLSSLTESNTYVWRKKYTAILQKLEREAIGDAKLTELVNSYKQQIHQNPFALVFIWYRSLSQKTKTLFWLVIVYALMGFGGYMIYNGVKNKDIKQQELLTEYINTGNITEAVNLVKTEDLNSLPLYNYYMNNSMWEEAEEFIPHKNTKINAQEYFDYCKKAIMGMCEQGQKKEAKKFIKRKVIFYDAYNSIEKEWSTTEVEKRLNAIVNNY